MELTSRSRQPLRRRPHRCSWIPVALAVALLPISACQHPSGFTGDEARGRPSFTLLERLPFPGWLRALGFAQQGHTLLAAGCESGGLGQEGKCRQGLLQVWSLDPPEVRATHRFPGAVTALTVSPDGGRWVAGDAEGRVVRSTDLSRVSGKPQHQNGEVTALAFSSDGKWVAAGSLDQAYPLGLFEERTGGMIRPKLRLDPVSAVAFSPDHAHLAVGTTAGGMLVWSPLENSSPLEISPGKRERYAVTGAAFSPDGRFLAYGRRDGRTIVTVWRVNQSLTEFRGGSAVSAVAFSPDGRYLAIGHESGHVLVVEPERGVEVWERRHALPVSDLAYSPDGKMLAVGALSQVYLYGSTGDFPSSSETMGDRRAGDAGGSATRDPAHREDRGSHPDRAAP